MNERISALMDGELAEAESRSVTAHVVGSRSSRDCWADYQLIGDALRRGGHLSQDISARVMTALAEEPVVLAPPRQPPRALLTPMAMAASVAAVMLVAGMVWGGREPAGADMAARNQVQVAQVPDGLRGENLQAYLVAHQTHAPVQTMHGAAHYLKTVAVDNGADR